MAVVNPAPNTISIELNYMDNPWFPAVLEDERIHAKATMKEDEYRHIWEGRCRPAVDGAIYFDEISKAESEGRIRDVPNDIMLKTHAIWDLGWNDSMSIILVQRSASELRIVDYIEDSHRTLADYAMQLKNMNLNWGIHYLPHDGSARRINAEVLKTYADMIRDLGFNDVEIVLPRKSSSRVLQILNSSDSPVPFQLYGAETNGLFLLSPASGVLRCTGARLACSSASSRMTSRLR